MTDVEIGFVRMSLQVGKRLTCNFEDRAAADAAATVDAAMDALRACRDELIAVGRRHGMEVVADIQIDTRTAH